MKISSLPHFLSAIFLFAAAPTMAADAAPQTQTTHAPSIIVVRAVSEHIVDHVLASGMISAVEEVLLQPQVEGLAVDELLADVGMRVEEGQVLARLSDDQLILQKSQATANLAKAGAALAQWRAQLAEVEASTRQVENTSERAAQLAKTGAYSPVQAEQAAAKAVAARANVRSVEESIKVAQAEIAVVEAQINDIELRLARTEVKAPVSGLVIARGARIGAIASSAAGPMFTLIRDGALELRADVSEMDILKLRKGQKAQIAIAGSDKPVKGIVRLVEPTLNKTSRLGTVRIAIPDTARARAGLFAEARIIVNERNGVAVPITSVSMTDDGASVLLVTDGRAATRKVKTGIRDDGQVEILKGLAAGDLIVAKAGAFVRDGERVKPVTLTASGELAAIAQ